MRCTVTRSTPTAPRSACHRWTTSATTSSLDRPWLAADPILCPWPGSPNLDVVQTGAWILPDERPSACRLGSVPECRHTAGVRRLQQRACPAGRRPGGNRGDPLRTGRRAVLSRGWADLALIDDRDDCFAVGEVNLQALFGRVAAVVHHGGAGTTTTATRAGAPQVVVPQIAGSAVLGRPGGRPGYRCGTRRPESDHRVPVGRAHDGTGPRDPRTCDRRGRHDPHRRRDGGREAAARCRQPTPAVGVRLAIPACSRTAAARSWPGCTARCPRDRSRGRCRSSCSRRTVRRDRTRTC